MRVPRQLIWAGLAVPALIGSTVAPVQAQDKVKARHHSVSGDKPVSVSRTVLVERGFHVVRVERVGERVYFEEAEPSVSSISMSD